MDLGLHMRPWLGEDLEMASLVERLRVRSDRRPVYNLDDSDDDADIRRGKSGPSQETVERFDRPDAVSPLNDIEKILDCETRPTIADDSDASKLGSKQIFVKQYLVKWKGFSYLHSSWVPENEFVKAYKTLPRLKTKVNNFHRQMSSMTDTEDYVAIRSEWTTVDRILACSSSFVVSDKVIGPGDFKVVDTMAKMSVKYSLLIVDKMDWREVYATSGLNTGGGRATATAMGDAGGWATATPVKDAGACLTVFRRGEASRRRRRDNYDKYMKHEQFDTKRRGDGEDKEYYVKWKELQYDECSWELESDICSFQQEIERFNKIQSRRKQKSSPQDTTESKKKQKEFQQYECSPEFLSGGSLHPYQLEGLNFLRFSWSKQTHVILADEMGLGKTIQSIAFLASLFEENVSPHLVVAPLSTLRNWEREFALWAPQMNVVNLGTKVVSYWLGDYVAAAGGYRQDREAVVREVRSGGEAG
nr:CHD3-type chromatin-remodeling factor PICKLE-like [Ipomoea batatas]